MVNQFTINLGFYMLMPYLAAPPVRTARAGGLDRSGWSSAYATSPSRACSCIGGTLADRLGYKPMIVAGCALRTVGFALLGFVDVGARADRRLGGHRASPGRCSTRRCAPTWPRTPASGGSRRSPLFNVFYQAGILLGPLVGLVLTGVDFRADLRGRRRRLRGAGGRPGPGAAGTAADSAAATSG